MHIHYAYSINESHVHKFITFTHTLVLTGLQSGVSLRGRILFFVVAGLFGKTPEEGVQSILYAAVSPDMEGMIVVTVGSLSINLFCMLASF